MPPLIDLTERRFGRLLVLERAPNVSKKTVWNCRCDCGSEAVVTGDRLVKGETKSCGCLSLEMTVARNSKHGCAARGSYVPEYSSWVGMRKRCNDPNAVGFRAYGGRGIKICTRWQDSFQAFLADMGPRPSLKHSLDRIDVNGDYEPGNCRWATHKQQARNTRRSHFLTHSSG